MKDLIKNNLSGIILIIMIIIIWFSLKGYQKNLTKEDQDVKRILSEIAMMRKFDSLQRIHDRKIMDSVITENEEILNELKYIKKQNDAINERNNKILDAYNDLSIDRPEF